MLSSARCSRRSLAPQLVEALVEPEEPRDRIGRGVRDLDAGESGISHRYLRPQLAIVDPLLTISCPPEVTAACGLDALFHAIEAYTTRPFASREATEPKDRPPYQGSNPYSDLLSCQAIELIGRHLRRAYQDGEDLEARTELAFGAVLAGIAFGGAGVHIPHACAYPIASFKGRSLRDAVGSNLSLPHGWAVAVTAPAAFRLVEEVLPDRCREAARLLDGGQDLANSLERLMSEPSAATPPIGNRSRWAERSRRPRGAGVVPSVRSSFASSVGDGGRRVWRKRPPGELRTGARRLDMPRPR
jgi:hypothetical protein